MNYHILNDHWFVDDFIATAEQVDEGNNTFLITANRPWRQVRSMSAIAAPFESNEIDQLFANLQVTDRVYVHWFDDNLIKYINNLPNQVELFLIFWGGDFISRTRAMVEFNHDPMTNAYLKKARKRKRNPIAALREYRARIIQERNALKIRRQFMARLNYFCHWNPRDLEILKTAFGGNPEFRQFYYGGGLDKIPGPTFQRGTGVRVWLGNSDTPSNNHLDAMALLKRFETREFQIICPLSYGNTAYGDFIDNKGTEMFADAWRSIRTMVPLPEYLKMQAEADVVIMNHNRSQAAGNIIAFVKMGKKVYLKRKSTIFDLLIEKGITIFDVKELEHCSFEEFSAPLPEETARRNSELITDLFSSEGKVRNFRLILKRNSPAC